MITGINYLKEIQERLAITDNTFKKACDLLKKVTDAELCKGHRLNVKAATLMYIACRLADNAATMETMMKATGSTQKEIQKCYKKMKSVLPGSTISLNASKVA